MNKNKLIPKYYVDLLNHQKYPFQKDIIVKYYQVELTQKLPYTPKWEDLLDIYQKVSKKQAELISIKILEE